MYFLVAFLLGEDMNQSIGNNGTDSLQLCWRVLLEEYKQALETANKSPKTICGYFETLKRYFLFLEEQGLIKPIHELSIKELRQYIKDLKNRARWPNNPHIKEENRGRVSPFTILAHIRDIKTFWSWMHREGYIENNPLAHFALPGVPEKLPKIIMTAQFKILLSNIDVSTADGLKYYCILLIFYDNGMRLSELRMIKIFDIDFESKTIKVMGKGRRERYVPITVHTRKHIIRYIRGARLKLCLENSPYLFANSGGEAISKNSVQQFMRRLLQKSGLKGIKLTPHILRHSFATQYLSNGGSIDDLQRILGHKSIMTTLRYIQSQHQDIQKRHAKFSPIADLFENKP